MSTPFSYTNPPNGTGYRVQSRMCLESDYFRKQYEMSEVAVNNHWCVRESEEDDEEDEDNRVNMKNVNNGSCAGAGGSKMHKSESNSSCCVCFNSSEEPKVNGVIEYRSNRSELQNASRGGQYLHVDRLCVLRLIHMYMKVRLEILC